MSLLEFLLICALLVFLFVVGQKLNSTYRRLPPGPIRWPILGSIPQLVMIDTAFPYRQFQGMAEKYGPIVSLGLGVHYTVVVSSHEMMKELFKRYETTMNRYLFQFATHRSNGKNLGIIWHNGETWKEVRKFTAKGLRDFGFGKSRSMDETIRDEAHSLVDDINQEISQTGGIWSVSPARLGVVSLNVVWSSLGGYAFDVHSETIREHIELNTDSFEITSGANPLVPFPFLKIFPEMSGYNRHSRIHQRFHEFMGTLIEDAKSRRNGRVEAESFVEVFLDEIEKNKGDPNTIFTVEQLVMIVMDLFFAGSETTSGVLNWLILYFTLNQSYQERAREELRIVSEEWTKSIPVTQSFRLPYLMSCIHETMRHSPFGTIPPARSPIADIECGGYLIPKGCCLLYNLYASFHDKAFWGEDADEYRPDRLLNKAGTAIDPEKMERLPQFGFGKRICPGETLALDTIFGVIVGVLSNFKIGLVEGREATLAQEKPSLVITPKPYVVRVEPIVH